MSIVRNQGELDEIGVDVDKCFLCCKQLAFPAIHWMGDQCCNIVLHPACVLDLFVRMARDLHQLKVEGDGYPFET